jgi:hypothetical protein
MIARYSLVICQRRMRLEDGSVDWTVAIMASYERCERSDASDSKRANKRERVNNRKNE